MKNLIEVYIWEGCDPSIADAIIAFNNQWQPYSLSSRRYPLIRLIEKIIDPALSVYLKKLPKRYVQFIPGMGGELSFSETIRLLGLETMNRTQRQLLRHFVKTEATGNKRDKRHIATLESLVELVIACACKRPQKSIVAAGVNLNNQRKHGFCDFCGNLTEFSNFIKLVMEDKTNSVELDDHLKLELSHKYCEKHKPKLSNGNWNPIYRRAKRSLHQFETELDRLVRQCAKRSKPHPTSGDPLVDSYMYYYLLSTTIQSADITELRNHARLITDYRLSDKKKEMLILKHLGFNKSDIAARLGIERQAVSKALASIPSRFNLDN